ncbi:MAG: flagellar assembly protein FliW [Firmicutes bacterium]|nr:flagellar assembly protein FliW [Bacillota bacterium]
MRIDTSKFGVLDVPDKKIITFSCGILGFENLTEYVLLNIEETLPFYWLQAVENREVALSCMNPFDVMPSYNPEVGLDELESLMVEDAADLLILTTVVVPAEPSKATVNLAAPIIINAKGGRGAQIVLQNTKYNIRQPIFSDKEGAKYADIVKKAE